MNREQYLEYINHFNNKRYDAMMSYFTPELTVEFFTDRANPEMIPSPLRIGTTAILTVGAIRRKTELSWILDAVAPIPSSDCPVVSLR